MDVMSLRRGIIAAMARGAEVIKGTLTIPSSGGASGTYTIDFGKTINKYLFFIEMTDTSKTALIASGQTSSRVYGVVSMYPLPSINNVTQGSYVLAQRYNPDTNVCESVATTASQCTPSNQSIELGIKAISNSYGFYHGYSYNYCIVSLDNI